MMTQMTIKVRVTMKLAMGQKMLQFPGAFLVELKATHPLYDGNLDLQLVTSDLPAYQTLHFLVMLPIVELMDLSSL
jgi:hypothetical protein